MNIQKLLVVGVLVAVGIGLAGLFKSPGIQTIVKDVGSVTGPDSYFQCETHNGIQSCFNRVSLTQATTTICAIKSPAATSTLAWATLHIDVSSSTTNTFTFARATTPYATTTVINISQPTVASGLEANIVATSSSLIFSPNTYFVVGQAGNSAANGSTITFSENGNCQAEFMVLTK